MRKILIVVDMQKDFIDGSLGTKEAQEIVPAVVKKIQSYSVSDIYVTKDTHGENYLETSEGKHLPVVHCIKGTEGWELDERVEVVTKSAVVVEKPTFGSIELMELLKTENEK